MLIPAFVLCRHLFKSLLLFLSANSSSDGFRSGLRLGSSFFMVLGLLLRSCAGKIKIKRVELLYNISEVQLLRRIQQLLTKNPLTAPKLTLLIFFGTFDLTELIYSLPFLQLYTKPDILSVLLTEIYRTVAAKACRLFGS